MNGLRTISGEPKGNPHNFTETTERKRPTGLLSKGKKEHLPYYKPFSRPGGGTGPAAVKKPKKNARVEGKGEMIRPPPRQAFPALEGKKRRTEMAGSFGKGGAGKPAWGWGRSSLLTSLGRPGMVFACGKKTERALSAAKKEEIVVNAKGGFKPLVPKIANRLLRKDPVRGRDANGKGPLGRRRKKENPLSEKKSGHPPEAPLRLLWSTGLGRQNG